MLSTTRKKLSRFFAARKERSDAVKVRCSFERLEDRAMLSASMGQMPHGHGNLGAASHGRGGPHATEPAAFASQPQYSGDYNAGNFHNESVSGSTYGFKDRAPMQESFGPGPEIHSHDPGLSSYPMWDQHVVSPPPPTQTVMSQREPMYSPTWDQFVASPAPTTRTVVSQPKAKYDSPWEQLVSAPPTRDVMPHPEPATVATWEQLVTSSRQMRTVATRSEPTVDAYWAMPVATSRLPIVTYPAYFDVDPFVTILVPNKPLTQGRLLNPISIDLPVNGIPSATNILAFASTLGDLPTLPQTISRDTNAVAMLSAAARDLAFQDYAPRLLLLTATGTNDRATFGLPAKETAPSETLDGFIRPYDETVVDGAANSADVLSREREAVNAVLRELRDVETPAAIKMTDEVFSPVGESQDGLAPDIQFEVWQTEITADEMPAGDVVGGMVLLQSTGDANESSFDLTPVYADQLERFDVQVGMETSVGLYQAVDVALDELPAADSVAPTDSTSKSQRELKLDDNLPAQHEQSSSHKAAALIGATTLTGALLWVGRSANHQNKPLSTAQNRRARRDSASP